MRDILFSKCDPGTRCPNVSADVLIVPLTYNCPSSIWLRHQIATVQPPFKCEWILTRRNVVLKRGQEIAIAVESVAIRDKVGSIEHCGRWQPKAHDIKGIKNIYI